MDNHPLPRLDTDSELRSLLLKYCRLNTGEIWIDPLREHRVGCLDAASSMQIRKLLNKQKAALAIHDPPYNFIAFDKRKETQFIEWSKKWVKNTFNALDITSCFYLWLGADYKNHFQPLPRFIIMMEESGFTSKNFITLRNQRGYGTSNNWMYVRQELLFYVKGAPSFNVDKVYTEIPKVLKGYYKVIGGNLTENSERGKSQYIRPGNVWIDVQQVFYRMEENVNGCFAQKPLKAIERIINTSSNEKDIVIDFFSHSGTTLIASEKLNRKCFTADIDPVFCEITIRRLERFRKTGKAGWQNSNPFVKEIVNDDRILSLLKKKYKISY